MAFTLQNSLLHRIGKFVKYTGLVDALTETGTFGVKVFEAALAGTPYVSCSLRRILTKMFF